MPQIIAQQYNFGVNEEDFPARLAENEIRKGINAIITRRGSLRKREGSSQFGTDVNTYPIYGLQGYFDNGGVYRRFKFRDTKVVEYNIGLWDLDVKTGLTAGLFLYMDEIPCASNTSSDNGTASAATDFELTDGTKTWTVNAYRNFIVKITGGKGIGQVKTILENDTTVLTLDGRWDIVPDNTSTYSIHAKEKALVCNNGTDTTFKILGTTAYDLTYNPKFTSQVVMNSRLWGIEGTKIRWSDLGNGEAFNGNSYIDTGEQLVAVTKVGDFLAVYSKTKTGVVLGNSPDNFEFKWRDYAHGCIAPRSVSNWKQWSFSLANDGVYAFDGTNNVLASRRIAPSIKNMKASDRKNSSGFVFENRYYLMHSRDSASTAKDRIWVMDLVWSFQDPDVGVWTPFEGISANVMAVFIDSDNLQKLYIGRADNSHVVQLYDGTYSDEGSSIVFDIESKEYDIDRIGINKKLGWFYYEGEVQIVDSSLQVYRNLDGYGFVLFGTIDHRQAGGLWDTAVWDESLFGGVERIIKRLRPGQRGRTIQYKFYNNIADQPMEIFKYEQDFGLHSYH